MKLRTLALFTVPFAFAVACGSSDSSTDLGDGAGVGGAGGDGSTVGGSGGSGTPVGAGGSLAASGSGGAKAGNAGAATTGGHAGSTATGGHAGETATGGQAGSTSAGGKNAGGNETAGAAGSKSTGGSAGSNSVGGNTSTGGATTTGGHAGTTSAGGKGGTTSTGGASGSAGNTSAGGASGSPSTGGAAGNGVGGSGGDPYAGADVPTTCLASHGQVGCCGPDGSVYYFDPTVGSVQNQVCDPGQTCGYSDTDEDYECVDAVETDPSGMFSLTCNGMDEDDPINTCAMQGTGGAAGAAGSAGAGGTAAGGKGGASSGGASGAAGKGTGGASAGAAGAAGAGGVGQACLDLGGKCVSSDVPPTASCPNGTLNFTVDCGGSTLPGGGKACCVPSSTQNACETAGGSCVALGPTSCPNGVIGDANKYSCGTGVGVECCLPNPYAGSVTPTTCHQAHGFTGCCGPNGRVYYYSTKTGKVAEAKACAAGTVCGWDPAQNGGAGDYGCTTTADSDPSGTFPLICGGTVANDGCPLVTR